jgi:hypothetical protein
MTEWAMAHPWMTFWLAVIVLVIAHDIVVAVGKTCIAIAERRSVGKTGV